MGIPNQTKSKATIRGSLITRQTKDKEQNPESKRNTTTKKERETRTTSQKPIEKLKETRPPPTKYTGLTRKLNNINDVITRGIKKSVSKENVKTQKLKEKEKEKEKEKAANLTKSIRKVPIRKSVQNCVDISWHKALSDSTAKSIENEEEQKIELERKGNKFGKDKASTIDVSKTKDETSQSVQRIDHEIDPKLKKEFEETFRSLKRNGTPEERMCLEHQRENLEKIYYEIALRDKELTRKMMSSTIPERSKSDLGSTAIEKSKAKERQTKIPNVNSRESLEEGIPIRYVTPVWKPCAPRKKLDVIKKCETTISAETLQKIQEKRESFQYLIKHEDLETKNSNSIVEAETKLEEVASVSPWNSKSNIFKSEENEPKFLNDNKETLAGSYFNPNLEYNHLDGCEESDRDLHVKKALANATEIDAETTSLNEKLKRFEEIGIEKFSKIKMPDSFNKNERINNHFIDSFNSFLQTARTKDDDSFQNEREILLTPLQTKPIYIKTDVEQNSKMNFMNVFHEKDHNNYMEKSRCHQSATSFDAQSNYMPAQTPFHEEKKLNCTTSQSTGLNTEISIAKVEKSFETIFSRSGSPILDIFQNHANSRKSTKEIVQTSTLTNNINENALENPILLLSISNEGKSFEETLKKSFDDINRQEDIQELSAQKWLENFLNRMSKIYDLSPNKQATEEKLNWEMTNSKQNAVEPPDDEDENNIETFSDQSDTQLLIQQLEYNIEQIRHGLMELGKTCETDFEKGTKKRMRYIPLSKGKSAERKLGGENAKDSSEDFFPHPSDFQVCPNPPSNTPWNGDDKRILSNGSIIEPATKKRVSWGKIQIETYINPSSSASNASSTQSQQSIRSATENMRILPAVSTKIFKDETPFADIEQQMNSPDYNESDDLQQAESIIELDLFENDTPDGSFSNSDLDDNLDDSLNIQDDDSAQDAISQTSTDLHAPSYTGCECMFKTYQSILQQVHGVPLNYEKS